MLPADIHAGDKFQSGDWILAFCSLSEKLEAKGHVHSCALHKGPWAVNKGRCGQLENVSELDLD